MLRLANPFLLLLLAFVPLLVFVEIRFVRRRTPSVVFPDMAAVREAAGRSGMWRRAIRIALRGLALTLLIVAVARPQAGTGEESVLTEGIDIVLALDVSNSMATEDFTPKNRLEVAKEVVADFIEGRTSDRIGMVVFAADSFTQCPLTLDYNVLTDLLESVEIGMIDERRTAIGLAIATAANRLRESDAESKVVILLTDGRNNAGEIDPITAAEAAQTLGIRIHTIGAGTAEGGRLPVDDPVWGRRYVQVQTDVDEETLERIAEITGGLFFRATSPSMLAAVYGRIDEMEKTKIEVKHFTTYTELGPRLAAIALVVLLLELLAAATVLRSMP